MVTVDGRRKKKKKTKRWLWSLFVCSVAEPSFTVGKAGHACILVHSSTLTCNYGESSLMV